MAPPATFLMQPETLSTRKTPTLLETDAANFCLRERGMITFWLFAIPHEQGPHIDSEDRDVCYLLTHSTKCH